MNTIAPNFVNVRLDEQDKQNFVTIVEHLQRKAGIDVSTAALYRAAIRALAQQHNIKGVR
jgi:predicted AAA+ superfamily ATPase